MTRRRQWWLGGVTMLLAAGLALGAPWSGARTPAGGDDVTRAQATPADAAAWEVLADLPGARTEASAVAAAGKLWVIGGIFPDGVPEGRVDVYDRATGAWSAGPPLPLPLHHAPAVAVGERIFVLGGFVGSPAFASTAATFVLDLGAPEPAWEPWVPLPAPRGGHAAATDGETIWIFGGVGAPGPVYVGGVGDLLLEASAAAIQPDAAAPAWTAIAPLPDPRDHLAGAFVDGKVYALGGRDLLLTRNTHRVDVYDPERDAWESGPRMPTARGGIGAAVLDGSIWVFGGETPRAALARVDVLDVANATWSRGPDMPHARHGVGVAALEGALYVEAGGPEPAFTYSATNQRLVPVAR